jgi:hypothetical protein
MEDGEMRVLDERNRFVARVGETVEAGGGEISRNGSMGGYEKLRRELDAPKRCTGSFWIITPPVERIGPG